MAWRLRAIAARLAVTFAPATEAEKEFCARMHARLSRHLDGGSCLHVSELFRIAGGDSASDGSRKHLASCPYCREMHARIVRQLG